MSIYPSYIPRDAKTVVSRQVYHFIHRKWREHYVVYAPRVTNYGQAESYFSFGTCFVIGPILASRTSSDKPGSTVPQTELGYLYLTEYMLREGRPAGWRLLVVTGMDPDKTSLKPIVSWGSQEKFHSRRRVTAVEWWQSDKFEWFADRARCVVRDLPLIWRLTLNLDGLVPFPVPLIPVNSDFHRAPSSVRSPTCRPEEWGQEEELDRDTEKLWTECYIAILAWSACRLISGR